MEPCLTLEFPDGYCEHCFEQTADPATPGFYDEFHCSADRGGPWAIWCRKECKPGCPHAGESQVPVRRVHIEANSTPSAQPKETRP